MASVYRVKWKPYCATGNGKNTIMTIYTAYLVLCLLSEHNFLVIISLFKKGWNNMV